MSRFVFSIIHSFIHSIFIHSCVWLELRISIIAFHYRNEILACVTENSRQSENQCKIEFDMYLKHLKFFCFYFSLFAFRTHTRVCMFDLYFFFSLSTLWIVLCARILHLGAFFTMPILMDFHWLCFNLQYAAALIETGKGVFFVVVNDITYFVLKAEKRGKNGLKRLATNQLACQIWWRLFAINL